MLGGGSAGWISACLLYDAWGQRGGSVTLVESPDIGIIGVGEGSTPQLKAFFDQLGIAEAEWMPSCDATYKFGIRFAGWSERPGYESYFHPFPGPVDLHSEPHFTHNCSLARRGIDVPAHPDAWFLAQYLASARRSPEPADSFPFAPSYGYHFDAYKLGAFLREWATGRGVAHLERRVVDIALDTDGDVEALIDENGQRIEGDLFVDCSGFGSVIAQQRLGVAFHSFDDNLFNDRAVVMPSAHEGSITPQTESIAMRAGWRWSIPLTTRIGNGYVYSSRYLDERQAEAELRAAIGLEGSEQAARHLRMKVGRIAESWHRNCLTAGLAQGFIEPLEATALHIVIATAQEFIAAYEAGGFSAQHRDAFNASIGRRYDGIRDYIVAHYRLNQRSDTDYWRDNASNDRLSDGLKAMMTAWFRQEDMTAANDRAYGGKRYYPSMSWHCLFAGYGTFPPAEKMQAPPADLRTGDAEGVAGMLEACLKNFAPYQPIPA